MGESGNMFGNYSRTLDEKNRIMIPAKLRDQLGKVFYMTLGPDNVLELRTEKSFAIWKDKLLAANSLNINARMFARILLGNTHEVSIDKHGRISITEQFLLKTGITKEATFVGVGNKIEIWPTNAYRQFQEKFGGEGSIDDLAKKLLDDGVQL